MVSITSATTLNTDTPDTPYNGSHIYNGPFMSMSYLLIQLLFARKIDVLEDLDRQ